MGVLSVDMLAVLPDEKLVSLCAEEPQAFEVLLERYRSAVIGMAQSYAGNPADAEDYAQEGMLGLLAAASSYQQKRGAGFRTYALICIRNRMRNIFNMEQAASRKTDASALSLDDPENGVNEQIADHADTPEDAFIEKERISELYSRIAEILSKQEREIFWLSVSGFSYESIADRLEISVKSVDNAIQRARRKLRAVWSQNHAAGDSDAEPL